MRIAFSISVALVSLLTTARAGECPFDRNPLSNGAPFGKVYSLISTIPKQKDEFEKSSQFLAKQNAALERVEARLGALQGYRGVIAAREVAIGLVHYDADNEVMSIETENSTFNPLFSIFFLDHSSSESYGFDAVYEEQHGKYTGENAFGVTVAITKTRQYEDFVLFQNHRVPYGLGISFGNSVTFRVPVGVAKQLTSNLELAVAGDLAPPFTSYSIERQEPKIDNPYDIETRRKVVFVEPRCAVIRGRSTREIYARWDSP